MTSRSRTWTAHIILAALAVWAVAPLVWMVLVSVRPAEYLYEFPTPLITPMTGENFQLAIDELNILHAILNSLMIATTSLVVTMLAAVPAAYALARGKVRQTPIIMLLILATQMIPGMASLVPLFWIVKSLGLFDTHLAVSLILAARTTPLAIWILKGFFDEIPIDLEDAAQVDGLTRLGVLRQVVLPLARPGMISAGLFTFMMAWIDFMVPLTFLFHPNKMPFTVLLYQLVGDPIAGTNYGALFAASILGSLPILLLFLLFQRNFIRGLTAGGVKG